MQLCRRFLAISVLVLAAALMSSLASGQAPAAGPAPGAPVAPVPIAIVPIDAAQSPTVTGALEVTAGKAMIAASGSVTSGTRTTEVTLPRRGTLRVCAGTTVKLAADTSVPASGGEPGLLMAMDHGALELSLANRSAATSAAPNADILMTPDFRILIDGPGAAEVKVRLGDGGDTCIENGATNDGPSSSKQNEAVNDSATSSSTSPIVDAPYVVVTSLFDSGLYRVQPGQRVMLQHGNLHEVVDQEKEPCGCPPAPSKTRGNDFPLAQSEGLEPTPPSTTLDRNSAPPQVAQVAPLVYSGAQQQEPAAVAPSEQPAPPPAAPTPPPTQQPKKKPGVFARLGHFFRRIFGAE